MEEFLHLNKLYGSLDELVQAGGGNISVKTENDKMIIKSSGYCFSDVTRDQGYTILKSTKPDNFDNYDFSNNIIYGANPSIETNFHLFLKKYVVHLHPTLINIYMCSGKTLPTFNVPYITIDYFKPGITLSKEIYKKYNSEDIIFLKNHGVIFTSNEIYNLKKIIHECYTKFTEITSAHNFTNLESYENLMSQFPEKTLLKIPKQCQQKINIQNIIPYTPDIVVYLHKCFVEYENNIYVIGNSKYKCHQILEVINSYIILNESGPDIKLSEQDVNELLSWDKEKYRTNMK